MVFIKKYIDYQFKWYFDFIVKSYTFEEYFKINPKNTEYFMSDCEDVINLINNLNENKNNKLGYTMIWGAHPEFVINYISYIKFLINDRSFHKNRILYKNNPYLITADFGYDKYGCCDLYVKVADLKLKMN